MTEQQEAPEALPALNIFPVKVTVNDTTYEKALLRTDGNEVEVWVENNVFPHDPIRVFLEEISDVMNNTMSSRYPLNKQAVDISTPTTTLHVQKQGGCGCGSKLRTIPRRFNGFEEQTAQTALEKSIAAHWQGA